MSGWNRGCVYAPKESFAKHCRKENEGVVSAKKQNNVGKGFFGCCVKCRFFKPAGGLPARYVMNKALE